MLALAMTGCGFCSFKDRKTYIPLPFSPKTFNTNEPPHPSEAFALRQSLTEMRRELELVNAELEFAEAAVTRMKASRSRLLSSMHGHEMALRPILSIPDDVLRLIFEWAVHISSSLQKGSYYFQSLYRASPWTISHTCSSWRVLAISYRPLWCNIIVPRCYSSNVHFLQLALQRSASAECGLTVHLSLEVDRFTNVLAPVLAPTSRRWCSLTVHITCDSLDGIFRGWPFDLLARLDLSFKECTHNAQSTAVTSFRDTPRLTRVSTEYLSNNHRLDLPWGQLVFYESRYSDLGILSQLSAVETILINGYIEEDWPDTFKLLKTKAPIRFPSLHTLSLRADVNGDRLLRNLSDILEVPSLKRLLVNFEDTWTPGMDLDRPKIYLLEHITHLSITTDSAIPGYATSLLRCARRVSVLYLGGSEFNTPMLCALQDTHILPSLECLQTRYQTMNLLAEDIIAVIEGRHCAFRIINTPLVLLNQMQDGMQEDLLNKWRSLWEQGIIMIDAVNREFQLEHL